MLHGWRGRQDHRRCSLILSSLFLCLSVAVVLWVWTLCLLMCVNVVWSWCLCVVWCGVVRCVWSVWCVVFGCVWCLCCCCFLGLWRRKGGVGRSHPSFTVFHSGHKMCVLMRLTHTHTHTGCFFRVGAFVFEKVLSCETGGPIRWNTVSLNRTSHFSSRKHAKMNSSWPL